MNASRVRTAFREQALSCADLGSPFTARLLGLAAERLTAETACGRAILEWQGDPRGAADSLPLRYAGGLNRLALAGHGLTDCWPPARPPEDDNALWDRIAGAMMRHDNLLRIWLDSPPQTNEVRRAAAILPALHLLAARYERPLALLELGASAGLNLLCDRFALTAGTTIYDRRDAILHLEPCWTGAAPPPAPLTVATRAGVDIAPLDVTDPEDRLRLLGYVWPDQPDRLARTRAAMAARPVRPAAGDAGEWLAGALPSVAPDLLPVIIHTVAWQYFAPGTCDTAMAALQRSGASDTVARVAMEADGGQHGAALTLTLWPGARRIPLGRADFHGRWVDWNGPRTLE